MCTDGNRTYINYLLLKDKIITDSKNEYAEQRIPTPAGCIPECLQRHNFPERWVKNINKFQDKTPCKCMQLLHNAPEGKPY